MIVRDEAEMLPRFLAAARPVWDELCVVDTGSTDDTVARLAAAGARVGHRPWDGDFAAARNAALALVTGDFILQLDADEMISPELGREIRTVVRDDRLGAATVVMRNELPDGNRTSAHLLRLYRAYPS